MKLAFSRRGFLRAIGAGAVSVASGCGMILHPERRGQPPGGGLDWSIVALDGLGLLLFFIPGVIAFAVDFATGAIYLPPDHYGHATPNPEAEEPFVTVQIPREELTRERVEQVTSEHAGREVQLAAGEYRTMPLKKIADFWAERARLIAELG